MKLVLPSYVLPSRKVSVKNVVELFIEFCQQIQTNVYIFIYMVFLSVIFVDPEGLGEPEV